MAYSAQITLSLALTGTNASGGGAVNEQTVALLWQGADSPAIRETVHLSGSTTLTPPGSPQPIPAYVLILLPVGVDVSLVAGGGSYDLGSVGQAILLALPNPYVGSLALLPASDCYVTVWWL